MNAAPVPLRGVPEILGMGLFMFMLGVLYVAATIWCAVSCLCELTKGLWGERGRILHLFDRQKEGER